jgi:NMD protein affecting ribosome stability and mRNA decay
MWHPTAATHGIPCALARCTLLRYQRPPWVACDLESKELLALCLKKVTGLQKVRLVDAGFVYTEPHSRRLKVKLTIQKEIESGAKLQQSFIVEYTLQNQQCDVCQRSYTNNTWGTCVQLRQKVNAASERFQHPIHTTREYAHPVSPSRLTLCRPGGPQEDFLLP